MVQNQIRLGEGNPVSYRNYTDENGNPTGGYAHGIGFCVSFQDGPRGNRNDGQPGLGDPNGAFVEDLLAAAQQRLSFFQASKYAHPKNQEAIDFIDKALCALWERAHERRERGVYGKNEV